VLFFEGVRARARAPLFLPSLPGALPFFHLTLRAPDALGWRRVLRERENTAVCVRTRFICATHAAPPRPTREIERERERERPREEGATILKRGVWHRQALCGCGARTCVRVRAHTLCEAASLSDHPLFLFLRVDTTPPPCVRTRARPRISAIFSLLAHTMMMMRGKTGVHHLLILSRGKKRRPLYTLLSEGVRGPALVAPRACRPKTLLLFCLCPPRRSATRRGPNAAAPSAPFPCYKHFLPAPL
jgi:hypothetical protein